MPATVIWLQVNQLGEVADDELLENCVPSTHSWAKYEGTWYPVHIIEKFSIARSSSKIQRNRSKNFEKKISQLGEDRFKRCPACVWQKLECDLEIPAIPQKILDLKEPIVNLAKNEKFSSSLNGINRKKRSRISATMLASSHVLSKAKVINLF